MQPDSNLIEPRFKKTIDAYVKTGRPTGHFIQAVLENDLTGAFVRADVKAMANLPHIISYLYHKVPSMCWGNKDKVSEWLYGEK